MNNVIRSVAALSLLVAGCAVRPPMALDPGQTVSVEQKQPGSLTVPLNMPALEDRSVAYAYDRNYINTVEVRLRDSLGTEHLQYVVRNAYLAGSRVGGPVNVTFHNVMPGVFTLTVRSSHYRLLSSTGPIKYDGLRGVFFRDADSDNEFDSTETEIRVISGTPTANFLTFAADNIDASWVFPPALRTDTSTTPAGFGVGGATESIVPGQTRTVTATVSQVPRWPSSLLSTTREVTAGETLPLSFADVANVQSVDEMLVATPSVTLSNGIVNLGEAGLRRYAITRNTGGGTIAFTPTWSTNPGTGLSPTPWLMWLLRGQSASEIGISANSPQITVLPALANQAASRFFGTAQHLRAGDPSLIQYDLRDSFGNRVAGNVTGVNSVPLGEVRRANAGITMDYAVVGHIYGTDPRDGLRPFIVPGLTTGLVDGMGQYTQGSIAPQSITEAATYSVTGTNTDLRLTRLEVPHFVYTSDTASFTPAPNGGTPHVYQLNILQNPNDANAQWIWLQRLGGPTIASSSITSTFINRTDARDMVLGLTAEAPNTLPTRILPSLTNPVVIRVPARVLDTSADNGVRFSVVNYGARRVSESDTVRVRVLNSRQSLFTGDVTYWWAQ